MKESHLIQARWWQNCRLLISYFMYHPSSWWSVHMTSTWLWYLQFVQQTTTNQRTIYLTCIFMPCNTSSLCYRNTRDCWPKMQLWHLDGTIGQRNFMDWLISVHFQNIWRWINDSFLLLINRFELWLALLWWGKSNSFLTHAILN